MADPDQTQQPPVVIVFTIHVGGQVSKPGPAPASKASIESLPTIKVGESGKDCSICLEEFEIDGEAREIPCKNVFHSNCVEKWLRIHGSCPVCWFLLPAEESSGGAGPASLDGTEISLGFMQSIFLAGLVAMGGSGMGLDRRPEQSDSDQEGEGDS